MKQKLINLFKKYNIDISENKADKFCQYFCDLIEWNNMFNLTAITEPDEVMIKHFLDSSITLNCFDDNKTICDVGSGAGFPAIPLAILREDLNFILVDSLKKRIGFLEHIINSLKLTNVVAIHSRAEDFAHTNREKFDYVLARAVASLPTLCEYCLPLVKVGGKFVAYKGEKAKEEINLSKNALEVLGGKIDKITQFNLENNERNIIIIKKHIETPKKYPRDKNLPKLKPL